MIREAALVILAVVAAILAAEWLPQRGCDAVSALPWLQCERR